MFLTTRGRYAIMAMLEVVQHKNRGIERVNLQTISNAQNISISYLEQLFLQLKRAGIVNSVKGPGGGYYLNNEPSNIMLSDIINAVGENIKMTHCSMKEKGCVNASKCQTHDLWEHLSNHIYGFFSSVSLWDVVNKNIKSIG